MDVDWGRVAHRRGSPKKAEKASQNEKRRLAEAQGYLLPAPLSIPGRRGTLSIGALKDLTQAQPHANPKRFGREVDYRIGTGVARCKRERYICICVYIYTYIRICIVHEYLYCGYLESMRAGIIPTS